MNLLVLHLQNLFKTLQVLLNMLIWRKSILYKHKFKLLHI